MLPMCALPADLLHAVAERRRRIAVIVGAGCSLEHPTGLKLAKAYSEEAHEQLVRDGVLDENDCAEPSDLSALATAVVAKSGGQSALVTRLPRNDFRLAQPNDGYLIAAALLREGVLDTVLTLNFDLAMSTALGAVSALEVNVVPGPEAADQFGGTALIYLHRNVDETDLERWILTVEALTTDWRDRWEEVMARRVVACPVVVFAGLGSPAAVLTQTVTRVRLALDNAAHHVFVADPDTTTKFEEALQLGPEAHLQFGWCAFMQLLATRLLDELASLLTNSAADLCVQHSWAGESEHFAELARRVHRIGLVPLGRLRARWLMVSEAYTPDDSRRALIADLLLGVGLLERAGSDVKARFREDGVVEFERNGVVCSRVLPASGGGTLRWAAMEPRALEAVAKLSGHERPGHVLVSGAVGAMEVLGPPEDVVDEPAQDDIISGFGRPSFVAVDDVRADPATAAGFVA